MPNSIRSTDPAERRGPRTWFVLGLTVVAITLLAAACGGGDDSSTAAEPGTTSAPAGDATATQPAEADAEAATDEQVASVAECPLEDGVVNIFATADVSAVAGDITPMQLRWLDIEVPKINEAGGVLGCELDITVEDEPLPDFESGIRKYRSALASGDYDLYFGMFDSALLRALPPITNAEKQILIPAGVGDHQPFYEEFTSPSYLIQAGVSTLTEGRAVAQFVADKGWKRVSILTPNYAYGQDFASAFKEYFLRLVPDGEIVAEQFPDFLEPNFQPFVNAALQGDPDVVVGGQYGSDILSLYKLWKAQGLTVPTVWFTETSVLELLSEDQIPENSYGYDRGAPSILRETTRGSYVWDEYVAEYGDSDHPTPGSYVFIIDSALQLVQALAGDTGGFDPDTWIERIRAGGFAYDSAYQAAPTDVNPINQEANTCATVGLIIYDQEIGQGVYDPNDSEHICLDELMTDEERNELVAGD